MFFVFCFVFFLFFFFFFFFFQAEDGIRDLYVTGVQTCALPIWATRCWLTSRSSKATRRACRLTKASASAARGAASTRTRSEERRVGKECRSRWSADH